MYIQGIFFKCLMSNSDTILHITSLKHPPLGQEQVLDTLPHPLKQNRREGWTEVH